MNYFDIFISLLIFSLQPWFDLIWSNGKLYLLIEWTTKTLEEDGVTKNNKIKTIKLL
tara:strand:+ start:238 stop:408 length:171 start_codon:yes stop_codon:yes gene_type:complete